MNATETLNQLHAKTAYWNIYGKNNRQLLKGVLVIVFAISIQKGFYTHNSKTSLLATLAYFAIMVIYCVITAWVFKRQEQIFTLYNTDNIKETLKQTIKNFKRFYIVFNVIYLFLYPAFFYAVIKALMTYWHPSTQTILLTCGIATIVAMVSSHVYYKLRFFKKLQSLEDNLKELEG